MLLNLEPIRFLLCLFPLRSDQVNASKLPRLGRSRQQRRYRAKTYPKIDFGTHRAFRRALSPFTDSVPFLSATRLFCSRFAAWVKNKTAGYGGTGERNVGQRK
jgi:hypothetical protein